MDTTSSPPQIHVGIFADDLTGAFDAAAPFAARGLKTFVSSTHELRPVPASTAVVSLNLGTRHMHPADILERVSAGVKMLAALGPKVLFNKIDSTLRGNPGAEFAIAMQALDIDRAVLCPAYPQNGRTVQDGVLLVDGVPVAETDVGRDPLSPVPSSSVVDILSRSLGHAGLENRVDVRVGLPGDKGSSGRPEIILEDATSEKSLREMAGAMFDARGGLLLAAGSAGLSAAIAARMAGHRTDNHMQPRKATRGILIVTASQRTVVDDQVGALARQIGLPTVEISVDEVMEGVPNLLPPRLVDEIASGGTGLLRLGKLDTGGGPEAAKLQSMAKTIVARLGAVAREIADSARLGAIVVIGGDTTSGLLEACGVSTVELLNELQPGTVVGVPVEGSIAGTLLVTRAGGFGDENSLLDLVRLLRSGEGV
jgi:uncharacterized protein YgbK (DUF1537 family)